MEYTGLEKFDQLQEKIQEGRFSLKKFLLLHGISFGVENDDSAQENHIELAYSMERTK